MAAAGLLAAVVLNVQSTDSYLKSYLRYTELVSNMEQAALTVKDGDDLIGTYSLEELGLLAPMTETAQECFGFSGKPSPKDFAALSRKERKAASQEVLEGAVSVDPQKLDTAAILTDLQTPRQRTGSVTPESIGAVPDEAILADFLRQAVSGWTATEKGMEARTVDVSQCAAYRLSPEEEPCLYREVLKQAMDGQVIPVTLFNQNTEVKMDTVLLVHADGTATVDMAVLEQLAAQWAENDPQGWVPYRLKTHDRGILELDFLHVFYDLDKQTLLTQLQDQLSRLDTSALEAPYLCTRDGVPYSIGDSYVEVDIAAQKMMYHENGEMLICTDVVTGLPNGHWTWPGIYKVQEKDTDRQLIAWDYSVHVDYWIGYDGDYGIHDAQWRDTFGGDAYLDNGSHGCVNTPTEAMAAIFEKVEVGTTVIVHFVKE